MRPERRRRRLPEAASMLRPAPAPAAAGRPGALAPRTRVPVGEIPGVLGCAAGASDARTVRSRPAPLARPTRPGDPRLGRLDPRSRFPLQAGPRERPASENSQRLDSPSVFTGSCEGVYFFVLDRHVFPSGFRPFVPLFGIKRHTKRKRQDTANVCQVSVMAATRF